MLKKIFLPSASVIIMLKGITGLQAMLPIEEVTKTMPPANKRRHKELAKPEGIHYKDRVNLIREINKSDAELTNALNNRTRIHAELEAEKKELEALAPQAGFTLEAISILRDEDCFLNRVTMQDAKAYGNLSTLVYDIDQQKMLKNVSATVTELDRQIAAHLDQISFLENRQKELGGVVKSPKEFDKFKKSLSVFGINFNEKANLSDVQDAIVGKISEVQKKYTALQRQKDAQGTQYLKEAQKVFANNLQGMNYEVEGVFHRNNGEFSGAAAYDKEHKKLVLSFAGSKSTMDWVKNIFGWNRKLSKGHGLLSNIAFHSGFGSHLDDNADSFFSFMRGWLEKFKAENPEEALELVGTGHSLGGSIGEIFSAAAKEMAEAMGIKVKLGIMTFGSPNTVNAATLDNYTKIIGGAGNVLRFAHSFDPVPKIVFWKSAPGGVTIEKDTSLFYDVNGVLELPIRVNPHSADDYYHASEKAFEEWEKSFSTLKGRFQNFTQLEQQEREINQQIGLVSKNAHEKLVELVNQDKISAATFADEYDEYVAQQRAEVDTLTKELKALRREIRQRLSTKEKSSRFNLIRLVSTETPKADLTIKEKEELSKKITDLRQRINEKNNFIESLSAEQAWKPYVEEIQAEFARLMESILSDSKSLM